MSNFNLVQFGLYLYVSLKIFSLPDWHIVEVDVFGPVNSLGNQFSVKTVRSNPADPGAVTGSATYNSFLSSIMRAGGKGQGIHLC